ncbi:unnamed protein product [Orchesella dallaii]|uniref:Uncharacterized protein n=1 Tax=Orchesella dallaii TaxID=48710 RepID=A0ABP1RBM2_9HEXA
MLKFLFLHLSSTTLVLPALDIFVLQLRTWDELQACAQLVKESHPALRMLEPSLPPTSDMGSGGALRTEAYELLGRDRVYLHNEPELDKEPELQ